MKTKYIKLITVIVLQMFLLSNVIASEARQSHLRKKGTTKVSDRDLIGGKFANLKGVKWLEELEMEGVDIKVLAPEKNKILTTEDFRRFLLDNKKLIEAGEQFVAQAKDNSITEAELREKIDKLLGKFLLGAEAGSKVIDIIFSLSADKIYLARGSGKKEGSLEASRSGASLSKKIVSGNNIFTILLKIYLHELRTVWLKERESIWENLLAVGITEYIDFDSGIVGSYSKAENRTIIEVVVGNLEPALDPAELGLTTEVTEVGANAMTIEVKKDGRIYISKEFNLTPQEIQYKEKTYKGGETKRIWEENTEYLKGTVIASVSEAIPLEHDSKEGARCPLTKEQILAIDKLMRAAGARVDYDILWEIGKTDKINNDSYTLHILQADPLVPLGEYQPIPDDIEPIAESYISQGNIKVDNGIVMLVEEDAKSSNIEAVCKELSDQGFEVIKVQRNAGCLELGNRKAGLDYISVLLDPSAPSKWVHTQVNFRDFVRKQRRPMALIGGRAFQAPLRRLDYYKTRNGIYLSKETVGVIANDRKAVIFNPEKLLNAPENLSATASAYAPSELDELFRGEERRGLLEIDAGDSIAMDRVIEYALEFLVKYTGIETLHPEIKELISDVIVDPKDEAISSGAYVIANDSEAIPLDKRNGIASPLARNDARELLNTIKHNPEAANQLLLLKNALDRIDKLHSIPLYPTYSQSNVVKMLLYRIREILDSSTSLGMTQQESLKSPTAPNPQRKILTKKNIKILITHIDLDTLETYQLELKNKGYNNIFIAANAKDAVSIIQKEQPDLLIQDINISSSQNILEEYAGIKKDKAVVIAWSGGWYSLEKIRIDWQKIDSKIEVYKFFYLGGIFLKFETVVGKCLKTQFNTIAPAEEIKEEPPKILFVHMNGALLRDMPGIFPGYKVFTAQSKEEAIEIIQKEKPDLLVQDVKFSDAGLIIEKYALSREDRADIIAWTFGTDTLNIVRRNWQRINNKIKVHRVALIPIPGLFEEPETAYQSLIRTIEYTITHEIQSAQKADSLLNNQTQELDSSL